MPESIPEAPPQPRFPLRVSPDRRRLLDVDGRPVLIQGDAAWSVIVNATLDSARRYIADRRRKGFNTIIVNLIDPLFATDPPRNLAGDVLGDLSNLLRAPSTALADPSGDAVVLAALLPRARSRLHNRRRGCPGDEGERRDRRSQPLGDSAGARCLRRGGLAH